MKLPPFLKKYFWDTDFAKLNLNESAEYIALRILEYGDLKAVQWLFRNISSHKLKEIIKTARGLSLKSLYFWSSFFNIDPGDLLCLKKSYQKMQKSHWPY